MPQLLYPSVNGFIRLAFMHLLIFKSAFCEIEYNNVNPDGSFSFRHSNDDIGSYYHSVAGNPNNNIRGRYGSRNPLNGIVEETIYTAGPRGFRVNGPQVHRKMDLSQIPKGPIGNIDDPLADPYDDPTYSFNFKTQTYSRNEETDSTGRVKGLYSYFDDIGEKHTVRYAAGAGTGFEILNSVPDNPTTLAYTAPLYKATPETRGKISVQRGRNGLYKFIATGPDQRRSEISGPDGIVRGAYSYLDDKGVQRTVEYEAGAGIGYRVIQNSIGRGTHRNTVIPSLRSSDTVFNSYLHSPGPSIIQKKSDESNQSTTRNADNSKNSQKEDNNKFLNENFNENTTRGGIRFKNAATASDRGLNSKKYLESEREEDEMLESNLDVESNIIGASLTKQRLTPNKNREKTKTTNNYNTPNFDDDLSSIPPIITSNRRILEIGREKDWRTYNRDSTIIKNVGKWYIGLPPGQSVRAHVQNIDILPIGGRNLSPAEALRRDELSSLSHI